MKKYFFLGLVSLLPIMLTIVIVVWLFDFFTAPFVGITQKILLSMEKGHFLEEHQTLVMIISRLMSLVMLIILIFFLGFFGRKFFFDTFMRWTNQLFLRIPFVKSVYRISKEITKAVFTEGQKAFKKAVLVPFPHHDVHSMGFVTGGVPETFKKVIPEAEVSVFVPTAPHPLAGFLLLAPKKEVLDVDISVEDGFKFILSCGVIDIPKKEESKK